MKGEVDSIGTSKSVVDLVKGSEIVVRESQFAGEVYGEAIPAEPW